MALSFTTGHLTLSNWGFSAGDIAVLAGAGRAVGNWVMNHFKDQALLQFMSVDPEELIPRKGLLDPTALHRRWDVRLTLLQNGNRRIIGGSGGTVVESMGIFSWLMTIIVSGLDASLQVKDMKNVMARFLTALFEEHIDGLDYLQRELPQHIQGWMSAVVVRNMVGRARQEWAALLEQDLRWPGQMPSQDVEEVVRFLVWLAGARNQKESRRFETASSDIFCLACVLQSIGLDLIKGVSIEKAESESDESSLLVVFNQTALAIGQLQNEAALKRECKKIINERGSMRIPLNFKEECVSLWPGTLAQNNDRRQMFKDGVRACDTLEIFPVFPDGKLHGFGYGYHDRTSALVERVDPIIHRILSAIFPIVNPSLVIAISRIKALHPKWIEREGDSILRYLEADLACLSKVQILALGYYYAMLDKVLDTSRMTIQEAYGEWRWSDPSLLYQLNDILHEHVSESVNPKANDGSKVRFLKREGILKLLAKLLAGAEEEQWQAVNEKTIGVHGKISVVSSSLLAAGDTADQAMKFCLLDLDHSAIPSTARGLILSGENPRLISTCVVPNDNQLCAVSELNLKGLGEDFTSHIEPDWGNDVQACHVVFRSKGRVIRRLAPMAIDRALLAPPKLVDGNPSPSSGSDEVFVGNVETFFSNWPGPGIDHPEFKPNQPPVLLPIRGCTKARVCMQTIYHGNKFLRINLPNPWPSLCSGGGKGETNHEEMIFLYKPGGKQFEEEAWETGRRIIIA